MMMYQSSIGGYRRTLPYSVSIVEEYGKIERKESTLSKWERDEVVRLFNNTYKQVKKAEY